MKGIVILSLSRSYASKKIPSRDLYDFAGSLLPSSYVIYPTKRSHMGWNSNSHLPVAVTSSQSLSFIHVLSPQQATLTVSPWSPRGEPGGRGGALSAGDMKPFPTEQKGPFPAS